jgi:hypothetical protein
VALANVVTDEPLPLRRSRADQYLTAS